MLDVVVQTFLTLDGVYQAPGGPKEDTEGGFKHGGWQLKLNLWDEESLKLMNQQIVQTRALLLGRKTYDIFAAYWPTATADADIAKKFNTIPKYVASRSMKRADWQGTIIIGSNLAQDVAHAKQQADSGVLAVVGSGKLAQSLNNEGLVDEYRLWIYPIVLGTGKRLFDAGVAPTNLKLVDSRTTTGGMVMLTYRPEKK